MTDYDTNLGVDRPNGNVVVSGWMHDAHMAGRTPGWLTRPQINITGPNTFEPFGASSAILMKRNDDDYIVAGDINPSSMELTIDRADNWANAEVYVWTSNDETTNPNGVGVIHLGIWTHDDDTQRVATDQEVLNQIGGDRYWARLYTLSIQGSNGTLTAGNINNKASDNVNGVPFIGNSYNYMSTLDEPHLYHPRVDGYEMSGRSRCVFEYGGGKDGYYEGSETDFYDLYSQWSYFTPGWYLAYAFLSFQPDSSTSVYYAYSGWAQEWTEAQNDELYFDMNIKTENSSYTNLHAHHEKTHVFYYDGPSEWVDLHLRETTLDSPGPTLSTDNCPAVNGTPCAQIFRIIRL